jgi:hypothetical protein
MAKSLSCKMISLPTDTKNVSMPLKRSFENATSQHVGGRWRLALQTKERQVPPPDGRADRQAGEGKTSEVDEMKRPGAASMASQRELIELAKTLDMDSIVRKTGRTPSNILISAKKLGIKIKERKAKNSG